MLKLIEAIFAGRIQTEDIDTVGSKHFRGELNCNTAQCDRCGACLQICPVFAITMNDYNRPIINYKRCVFCGKCVEACAGHALYHSNLEALPEDLTDGNIEIGRVINTKPGRSIHVRHLDAGSCNACDFEMAALSNPLYDLHRFGISFVASPRHADVVMVTGVVTRNLEKAVNMTYEAMENPKVVIPVEACASGEATNGDTYAIVGALDKVLPVDIFISGCPPRPSAMVVALLAAADLYLERSKIIVDK